MAVAPVVTETPYALAGAGLGPFSTVFPYAMAADVQVWLDTGAGPGLLAAGADYTLTETPPSLEAGGEVTLSAVFLVGGVWPAGSALALIRLTPNSQPSVFGEIDTFSPSASEAALDNVERQVQEVRTALQHGVRTGPGEAGYVIPDAAARANKLFGAGPIGALGFLDGSAFKGDPGGNAMAVGPFSTFHTLNKPAGVERIITTGWLANGDGGAGAYRHVGAGPATAYRGQFLDGTWWELDEILPFSKQFGAFPDGVNDVTAGIHAMRDYSIATRRKCYFSPSDAAHGHIFVGELRLDAGAGGFDGAALAGFGINRSYLTVRPTDVFEPLCSFYGGSGDSTNKSLEDLTIIADAGFEGMGKGIYLDGQCFALVNNVLCINLQCALSLNNNQAASFTESNVLTRIRGHHCTHIIEFGVNGGGDSFRDNTTQVRGDPAAGGVFCFVEGMTDRCYIYENRIDWNADGFFGGTTLMELHTMFAEDNVGAITAEQNMAMVCGADANWNGNDVFSTYPLAFAVTAPGSMDFDSCNANHTPASGHALFADARINTKRAGYWGDLVGRSQGNTRAPSIFPVIGGGELSVGLAAYEGSWFYFFKAPFGAQYKDLVPGIRIDSDGSVIETMRTNGIDIREYGQVGQLLVKNGRVGGRFGRGNPKGVAHAPVAVPATGTYVLATAADRHSVQLCHVRIAQTLDGATNVDINYVLAWRHTGFGGPGAVKNLALNLGDTHDWLDALNTSGGLTVTTVLGDFSVSAAGDLQLALATTQALIVEYYDLSLGTTGVA